ncbi:MAG: twin-arginine translocation signal domain-containing protein [Desulfofustis sp.]|nr:twin-arginine translocation signal domain-containing protein [Desulfofustis sp.]
MSLTGGSEAVSGRQGLSPNDMCLDPRLLDHQANSAREEEMNNRRDFLKASLVVSAGLAATGLMPGSARAATIPEGIIYTKENPGRWAGKEGSHSPVITVEGNKLTVETKHEMTEHHYIVKHTVISGDGQVLDENTFYPTDEKAISTFEIEGTHSMLYVTSFCDIHDLWLAEVKL